MPELRPTRRQLRGGEVHAAKIAVDPSDRRCSFSAVFGAGPGARAPCRPSDRPAAATAHVADAEAIARGQGLPLEGLDDRLADG
eukprot:15451012-Alexandrium_andersonii.AAC.1